jgi:hypothetical protein
MRTIHLETTLPTSADRVWRAMQSPVTFLYVCKGLFAVPVLSGRAEPLRAGERGTGWLFAFHVVPAYRHTIEVIDVDEPTQTIRTHEHGGVLRAWNHTLKVLPIDEAPLRSVYTATGNDGGANSFGCICCRRVRPTQASVLACLPPLDPQQPHRGP